MNNKMKNKFLKLIFCASLIACLSAAEQDFIDHKMQNHEFDIDDEKAPLLEQEQVHIRPRRSACNKISKFFCSMPAKIRQAFIKCLKKPGVLKVAAAAPLALESLGGYYTYKSGDNGRYAMPFGIWLPVLAVDGLYHLIKHLKETGCKIQIREGFTLVSWPTLSIGVGSIILSILGLMFFGNFQLSNLDSLTFFVKISSLFCFLPSMYACISSIIIFRASFDHQISRETRLHSLMILPVSIFIIAPYRAFKEFLEDFIIENDTESNSSQLKSILAQYLKIGNIQPLQLADIVLDYASTDEEFAVTSIMKNQQRSLFSVPNRAIIELINEYAQKTEDEEFFEIYIREL